MKKPTQSFPLKALAFFLAVVCLVTAAGSALAAALLLESGYYSQPENSFRRDLLEGLLYRNASSVMQESIFSQAGQTWQPENSNLRLRVSLNGIVIEDTREEDITAAASIHTSFFLYGHLLYRYGLGPWGYENGCFFPEDAIDEILNQPGIQRYLQAGGTVSDLFGGDSIPLGGEDSEQADDPDEYNDTDPNGAPDEHENADGMSGAAPAGVTAPVPEGDGSKSDASENAPVPETADGAAAADGTAAADGEPAADGEAAPDGGPAADGEAAPDGGPAADGETAPDGTDAAGGANGAVQPESADGTNGTDSAGTRPEDASPTPDDQTGAQLALTDVPGGLGSGIWIPTRYREFEGPTVTVELWLTDPLTAQDSFYQAAQLLHMALQLRGWLIPLAVIGLLVFLVCLVFLCCAAGHRAGCDIVQPGPLERIPLDLYAGAVLLLGLACAAGIFMCLDELVLVTGILAVLCFTALVTLGLAALLSLVVRIKCGNMLQNTLCWWMLRFCWRWVLAPCLRGVRRLYALLRYLLANAPLMWKTSLGLGGLMILDFTFTFGLWDRSDLFVYWFFKSLLVCAGVLLIALNLRGLQKAIRRMANGDLDAPVDLRFLIWDFRRSGEDLGRIRTGMTHAVDERMKSERLKTELITNVSHDIKTPLTSIINYVDLIKKQQPEDETLCEYIDVLDRQSTRLKKLIEDLIEASKASSGVLANHAEPCELAVLLAQVSGEYSEKLAAAGLALVADAPQQPLCILADGRHLWRVFDNLLNNICKYAQSGTRVYLTLQQQGDQAVAVFRNISREALNISGDELMERFVRGDRSRHTEGSGLGLSIARSLTEMQRGTLDLDVDGDLFKVTLRFPLLADGGAPNP